MAKVAHGSGAVRNPARTIVFLGQYIFVNSISLANQEIYFWQVGCSESADRMIRWIMQRGINPAATPAGLVYRSADLSSQQWSVGMASVFTDFTTTEPQYTTDAILWKLALNQRAKYHVKFNKRSGGGISLLKPQLSSYSGVGIHAYHESGTPTANALMHFRE